MTMNAAALIHQLWPEHVSCAYDGTPPFIDQAEGVVCSCGTILGWPTERPNEGVEVVPQDAGPAYFDPQRAMAGKSGFYREGQPDYKVGDTVNVGGIDFTKHSELPSAFGPSPDDEGMGDHPEDDDGTAPQSPKSLPAGGTSASPAVAGSAVEPEDPITAALSVIDPTVPVTPEMVEAQMVDIQARLERGQHFQRLWEERAYADALAYQLAFNREIDRIFREDGCPADVRKARADLACEEELKAKRLSEAVVKMVRETMHNLRSQLSGYQTISRSTNAVLTGPQQQSRR